MNTAIPTGRVRLRAVAVAPVAGALLLTAGLLAACGGTPAKASSQPQPAGNSAAGTGPGGGGNGQFPGATGTLAQITGTTLQVQNPSSGQVAVNYTGSTAFTQTKTVTVAALKVGDCVTVTGQASASSSPTVSPSSRPTSFPAATVAISAPVSGSCTAAGGRFGGGARPSGFPSGRPSNFPSGRPSGAGGRGFGGDFATGSVTAVTSSQLTVAVPARGQQAAGTDTVTLGPSTSYTETVAATPAALKVGECVFATGRADSTGAIAATRIQLSAAGPNGCTIGFGRRPRASSTGA